MGNMNEDLFSSGLNNIDDADFDSLEEVENEDAFDKEDEFDDEKEEAQDDELDIDEFLDDIDNLVDETDEIQEEDEEEIDFGDEKFNNDDSIEDNETKSVNNLTEDEEEIDFGDGESDNVDEFDGIEDTKTKSVNNLTEDEIINMSDEELEQLSEQMALDEVKKAETEEHSELSLDENEEDDETEADEFGTEVSLEGEGLSKDSLEDGETIDTASSDFINSEGEIAVMDNNVDGDNFELQKIPLEQITVVKRIRQSKSVDELVQSIRSTGLIQPITLALTVTEGVYVLIDGYRRVLACAKAGIKKVPAVINKRVTTTEIPILEAMYNHKKSYTMREMIDYIDYLEKEKGIMSASMIEFLLQLDSGDYSKLKDVLEDDDEDIINKLLDGQYNIAAAFKALEKRRAKESKEEKDMKKTAKVYADAEESGVDVVNQSGETGDEEVALTDEEIAELSVNVNDVLNDTSDEDKSLEEMVADGKTMEGFEPDKQNRQAGEQIDPAVRKAVLTRDGAKCKCCGFGGPGLEGVMDIHHVTGVAQGQNDDVDGLVTLCITCHMLVEMWGYGRLPITGIDTMPEQEKERMKKVIKIGNIKRDALIKLGKKREQIKEEGKKATQLRRMPGASQPRA